MHKNIKQNFRNDSFARGAQKQLVHIRLLISEKLENKNNLLGIMCCSKNVRDFTNM